MQEGQSFNPRLSFTNTGPKGKLANAPRYLRTHLKLALPGSSLLGSVTEKASMDSGRWAKWITQEREGGAIHAAGKVVGMDPALEPHDRFCPGFCPDLSRPKLLVIR